MMSMFVLLEYCECEKKRKSFQRIPKNFIPRQFSAVLLSEPKGVEGVERLLGGWDFGRSVDTRLS